MHKDIKTYNAQGKHHGYQEWYSHVDAMKLYFKGNRINSKPIAYSEWHTYQYVNYNIR